MADKTPQHNLFSFNVRGNLIAGLLTIMPLVAVWLVFDFLLGVLFEAGRPLAQAFASFAENWMPQLKPILGNYDVQWLTAVLGALFVLYVIGAVTSRVVGRRLVEFFEGIIVRIPLVETIYSAAKKLVGVLQHRPNGSARVVLTEFPHPGVRAVGLVMRTFRDSTTGEELAAVLVPTAPNPTTGYLQIVPASRLTPTDMSVDQAMTMIISGGTTAPDRLTLNRD